MFTKTIRRNMLIDAGDAAKQFAAELDAELRRVSFKNYRYPIRFDSYALGEEVILRMTVSAPDRNTGETIQLEVTDSFTFDELPPDLLMVLIERRLRYWAEHEILEAFHVDGVRVLDPHAAERVLP